MTPPRFLVTTAIPDSGMDLLAQAGEVHVLPDGYSPQQLKEGCASGKYDVVVAQLRDQFDEDLLSVASIRGISNYSVGFDNVDVDAATRHGIIVCNTPGVLTTATADLTMLLLLAVARRCVEGDDFLRSGRYRGWKPDLLLGSDVTGATLGLVGFGRIAQAVARRALAFDMKVLCTTRTPPSAGGPHDGSRLVSFVPWEELLGHSDYLSLHVPHTHETHHLVDEQALKLMKPSAYLINTARGAVVDEQALVDALKAGSIAGAALDVYEDEPAVAEGLTDLTNTVLLPHLGSATRTTRSKMAQVCANNAIAVANGGVPNHVVNGG
ncbi:MAG TPA: D-glycerate dehydrogenase [Segeticoccus sp.]|uniref:2-hydroxyacid dehydrogenase n=1 Tax=Segeticoccus sp. TaxID=2706531 RepID=UPI002D7ED574|nr:D-glycerate dehydrogenase [Segeticoccus sp.]HET8600742.1 D-glycerate dehydrogenase [Segeticoccus sp.]